MGIIEEKEVFEELYRDLKIVKVVKELPDKPEPEVDMYYVNNIWSCDVYLCCDNTFLPLPNMLTLKGGRLVASVIQILIRIIDAMHAVYYRKNEVNGYANLHRSTSMCLVCLKIALREKFFCLMCNGDKEDVEKHIDKLLLEDIKIVL